MKLNRDKLVKIAVQGQVDHPRMKGYRVGFDGKGRMPIGTGGITYSHAIGDPCMGLAGDHVEPGISLANPGNGENHALETFACVGNEARIINGPKKGEIGYVSGTHGGIDHTMICFDKSILEEMDGNETILVKAYGQGMKLLDHPEIGSVCSGGRYDNLAAYYTQRQLPGVGISIGLTRLFYVLQEQGLLNPALPTAPADALVLPMTEDPGPAIAAATYLREAGIRTQIYLEQKKFKQKMSYCDKLGIPYAVVLGEDEIAAGGCAVKDMATGQQVTVSLAEAAQRIAQGVAEKNQGPIILER